MSGGSFNYLCYTDIETIVEKLEELESMADALAKLGYANDAAKETTELLLYLRARNVHIETHLNRLSEVWHAVEWWRSCDSGESDVKKALVKYRGER